MLKIAIVGCTGKLGSTIMKSAINRADVVVSHAIARKGNQYVGRSHRSATKRDSVLSGRQLRIYQSCENVSHHEVVFFYLMKNANIQLKNGVNTDQQNEHLYWVPIEGLEKINLVPAFLKTAIQDIPNEITHIVSYE